jgi:predicted DCC family thiol-disulfide oxidoreductase YuxK
MTQKSPDSRCARKSNVSLNAPLLLYDGQCGFCAAAVQFILRHEREHSLLFAALDSEAGTGIRDHHVEVIGIDSMIWVEPSDGSNSPKVLVRSAAALRIASYLGGPWRVAAVGWVVPRVARDAAYDLVARHRHRLIRRPQQCFLPTPSAMCRFIG